MPGKTSVPLGGQ